MTLALQLVLNMFNEIVDDLSFIGQPVNSSLKYFFMRKYVPFIKHFS